MNKVMLTVGRGRFFPLSRLCCKKVVPTEAYLFSTHSASHLNDLRQNYQVSLVHQLSSVRQMGFVGRLKERMSSYISDGTKTKIGGVLAYEKIGDDVNYSEIMQYFQLPDTFQSWFVVMQLHVYMTVLVTAAEKHGKLFRNSVIDSMWNDVEMRIDRLGKVKSSKKKEDLKELVGQFSAGFISYDEGVCSDDTVLAATCWRMLFQLRNVDPELLENAVLYIRKQISHLDSLNVQNIIFKGHISFLPLKTILSEKESV